MLSNLNEDVLPAIEMQIIKKKKKIRHFKNSNLKHFKLH